MNADFAALDELKSTLDSLLPMSPEDEKRLWQKFRLEWNFHSNHIEGNTLTYGETELFFLHDKIQSGHTHREYVEMKAHDAAIEHVRMLAQDERPMGEADIRDLNRIALKEPFWKEAVTADGQPSRKQVIPGEYKTTSNNVRTVTGETFFFASPEETPAKMQQFMTWLRTELTAGKLHPVEIATRCHHDFVLIHPFDDGNGRVARLLVNYTLLRSGFPPVIIRSEKKPSYLSALQQADVGSLAPLTEHLASELRWSLETAIKAARGESIEEISDAEKELQLFVRQQTSKKREVLPITPETLRNLYDLGWRALFESFERKMLLLSQLFATTNWSFQPNKGNFAEWRGSFDVNVANLTNGSRLALVVALGGYIGEAKQPFNFQCELHVLIEEFQYQVLASIPGNEMQLYKGLYSEPLVASDAERLTAGFLKQAMEAVKSKAESK